MSSCRRGCGNQHGLVDGVCPGGCDGLQESCFLIYRWEEGGEMYFERRLFLKHQYGEAVTPEMVRAAVEAEIFYFKPTKYRAFPESRMVDFEVKGAVVLS